MSRRSELQQGVIAELEAMGLVAEGSLGRVQGKSGYSRDVYFEDVRVGFAGRLRIFSESFVTVNFGQAESERWDSVEEAVTEVATYYSNARGTEPHGEHVPQSLPGRPERDPQTFPAGVKGRPSAEAIESVRKALLALAADEAAPGRRREFAQMAVALGATAEELLILLV